jgi:transglutaminase-like putative cysteine protease
MIYDVNHRTTITYDGIVRVAEFNIRMRPASWPDQEILSENLKIEPAPARVFNRDGAYLSPLTRARIDTSLKELAIDNSFRVKVERTAPEPHWSDPPLGDVRREALGVPRIDALAPANYLYPSRRAPLDGAIADWCATELKSACGVIDAGLALAKKIQTSFRYDPNVTEVDTPVEEAFAKRHGVCQDYAHIMISGLRSAGLPAAYVSGYLRTEPPPGKPKLMGVDATHAWVMIWCGAERGWVGFDPTNGCTVGAEHILAAVGRDYADVSPIDGILLGLTEQTLKVAVDVTPVEAAA